MTCEIDDSGSGGTVGPGTINRIAKFTAASTIGDSIITDNGTNIGIGIVNPTYKLHILKPSGASGSSAIKVENDNAGQPVGIEIDKADAGGSAGVYYSTNGAAKWFAGTYTNNGYSLRDTTAGATRLYIDSTGNVGIGITAPTSLLHIAQSQSAMPANTPLVLLQTTGTAASTKGSLLHLYTTRGTGTDDTDLFKISNSGGSTFMTVRNTGNIGVGVANPRTLLHLSSSGSALRLEDNNSDGVGAVNYLEFYDSNSRQGYLGFGSSVNSDMFFTNEENGNWIFSGSGGMGISTTTPYGAKLNVSGGPIKASGGLILENRTTDVASPESGAIWICVDTGNDCH